MWKTITILILMWQHHFSIVFTHFVFSKRGSDANKNRFCKVNLVSQCFDINLEEKITLERFDGGTRAFKGDLGAEIRQRVEQKLSHLKHLGENIREQVNRNLAPVHAMKIKSQLRNGIGGVTTVLLTGKRPRKYLIRNGERFLCYGNFVGTKCDGPVESFTVKSDEDFCFSNSYASFNDYICLSNSAVNINTKDNQVFCNSIDGLPYLLLTTKQYDELCGDIAYFTYYSDPTNPQSIPIPNSNPHVQCLNMEPGICRFTEEVKQNHKNYASSYFSNNYYSLQL